jgi:hypothetical protein
MLKRQNREVWMFAVVVLTIAGFSIGKPVDLPTVFSANTPARASEVNANFSAVKSAVDDNQDQLTALAARVTALTDRVTALEASGVWKPLLLENEWVNYGSGFQEAQYRIDPLGVVYLRGLIRFDTAKNQSVIATLPVGIRPTKIEVFVVNSNGMDGRVDVNPNGTIAFIVGSGVYVSLSGLQFSAR